MQTELLANGTVVYIDETNRFGQDALLLAQFSAPHPTQTACDLGTGCGIIPLRWHDRGHRGICFAVELQSDAVNLMQRAVKENKINHMIPICGDLRSWRAEQSVDLVSCNPPYFKGGPRSPDIARAQARHEETCTLEDVCTAAADLLRDGGRLCICQRPERLADVISAMRAVKIEPKKMQFVAARPEKAPWLVLIEGQKYRASGLRMLPTFFTQNPDGRPSEAMLAVYGTPNQQCITPQQTLEAAKLLLRELQLQHDDNNILDAIEIALEQSGSMTQENAFAVLAAAMSTELNEEMWKRAVRRILAKSTGVPVETGGKA